MNATRRHFLMSLTGAVAGLFIPAPMKIFDMSPRRRVLTLAEMDAILREDYADSITYQLSANFCIFTEMKKREDLESIREDLAYFKIASPWEIHIPESWPSLPRLATAGD